MIRKASVAGGFYPSGREELKRMIEGFLRKAENIKIPGKLRGLVVPHAGYIYSGSVAAYGYKFVSDLDQKKEWKVFLLGPSHYFPFEGFVVSDADFWQTPLGNVTVDKTKIKESYDFQEVHIPEHCLEVQIPFLQTALKKFKIIPILLGKINPKKLADLLLPLIDENSIIIASSDLSHYYPYNEARKIDSFANKVIPSLDMERAERADACGLLAILTLMWVAKKAKWSGAFVDYKNSGDTSGSKNEVVGYGCYAFHERL